MDAAAVAGAEKISRILRQRERKVYTDDGYEDDYIEGRRTFSLEDKINCEAPTEKCYLEMKGSDLTLKYFQTYGFMTPILIREKTGLGLRIPSENFTVNDVKRCVGSSRVVDVMDVSTQKGLLMTVKDWVRYYENPKRSRLLNVISLEFSHTQLENYVDQPHVIHQMDWVDLVWPRYLREHQTEATNVIAKMKYPKVQKYCLMSVGGCYTDFHIDMGGTSVWYHILKGKKMFWLIPPTDENILAYESWTLSGRQGDTFFGDLVSTCHRVTLEAGVTFFIPTGWIHAVYTPEDSLVFGGNFLHCFNIPMQLRIWEVECKTRVPSKFRYPLFLEIHWYVLERYVSCLLGIHHRIKCAEELGQQPDDKNVWRPTTGSGVGEKVKKEDVDLDMEVASEEFQYNANQSQDKYSKDSENNDASGTVADTLRSNIFDIMSMIFTKRSDNDNKQLQQDINSAAQTPDVQLVHNYGEKKKNDGRVKEAKQQTRRKEEELRNEGEDEEKEYMLPYELEGLETICYWLERLPINRRNVPKDIPNPNQLIADARELLSYHKDDDPELAITGKNVIRWSKIKKVSVKKTKKTTVVKSPPPPPLDSDPPASRTVVEAVAGGGAGVGGFVDVAWVEGSKGGGVNGWVWKHRRIRCKTCEPCTRSNCMECIFCKDMVKYGGPGRTKKTCISRQCMGAVLPSTAQCEICDKSICYISASSLPSNTASPSHSHPLPHRGTSHLDSPLRSAFDPLTTDISLISPGGSVAADSYDPSCELELMECRICFEIVHPACMRLTYSEVKHRGVFDEDIPQSWQCARCCAEGLQGTGKHRTPRFVPTPFEDRNGFISSASDEEEDDRGSGGGGGGERRDGGGRRREQPATPVRSLVKQKRASADNRVKAKVKLHSGATIGINDKQRRTTSPCSGLSRSSCTVSKQSPSHLTPIVWLNPCDSIVPALPSSSVKQSFNPSPPAFNPSPPYFGPYTTTFSPSSLPFNASPPNFNTSPPSFNLSAPSLPASSSPSPALPVREVGARSVWTMLGYDETVAARSERVLNSMLCSTHDPASLPPGVLSHGSESFPSGSGSFSPGSGSFSSGPGPLCPEFGVDGVDARQNSKSREISTPKRYLM